jgi:XTP/dITP diphosphohydrolase
VPFGQPALSLAAQLQRRAERAGVPQDLADLSTTSHDPVSSGAESGPDLTQSSVSEVGAELFALVARASEAGLDPELELRAAARAYRDRVLAWEHVRPEAR